MRRLFAQLYVAMGLLVVLGIVLALALGRPQRAPRPDEALAAVADFPVQATAMMARNTSFVSRRPDPVRVWAS